MEQVLQGIQAVYFDLDDTLYDQLEPFEGALAEAMPDRDWIGVPVARLFRRVRHYSDRLWEHYAAGLLSLEDMRTQRLILAFEELGLPTSVREAEQIQRLYARRQGVIRLSEGAAELIAALQRHGFEVGMMTNGPVGHQQGKIRALGLDRIVDAGRIFISDAIGVAKPDPAVFAHINTVSGVPADRCLYIGDDWRNDIAASAEAGWRQIWLNRRGADPGDADRKPAMTIDDLRRLLELPQLLL